MSSGRSRSDNPFGGDPLSDPSLEKPLSAVRALAGSQFEVLGSLGRDAPGEYAFLAREASCDRLVVLKLHRITPPQPGDPGTLQVITQLDSSVPPPAGSCPACQAPFNNWEPLCPECGANVAGGPGTAPGRSSEEALALVRQAAEGHEVFGTMNRAVGGAPVFFARDLSGGHLVALRLEDAGQQGQPGYTVTASRMTRPKLLYGAVGGDPSREAGGIPRAGGAWTPDPSPSLGGDFGRSELEQGLAGRKICPQCNQTFGADVRLCPRDGVALRAVVITDSLIGRIIAERYHIVDRLGQGGMGTVYLAEHVRMGRRCAVKVMNPTLLNDPDSLDRFTREAKNASLLNHPHVAAIYDFGETPDGIVYLAMEFVEGESLDAVLDRMHGLSEQQALELASQVADGLSAAHEMGIVHRDLKPDNIMVCHSKSGRLRVKVVDFGIAKATQGGRQTVTRAGYVVGTPAYMSPEQILGDPLDGRSDLYSLGCILYEMLTGQRPFAEASGEVSIRRRLTEPPPHARTVKEGLSKTLDEIVSRAMARSPEQRFQSAAEIRDALLALLNAPAGKAKSRRWLPWSQPEPAVQSEEKPLVLRTPEPSPSPGALLSPAPFLAASPLEHSADVDSTSDWPKSVQPTSPLRHRSARNEGSHAGWVVGGAIAVMGIVAATVFLLRGGELADYVSKISASLPSRIAPTKTERASGTSPPGPIELPADTTASAADSSPPIDQVAAPVTAAVRLGKPLPQGSRVIVDSNEVQPNEAGVFTVNPGSHVVRVRAPGYRSARRTLAPISAGDTATLDLVLLPLPLAVAEASHVDTVMGTIVVKGDLPSGSVIRVDGRVAAPGARILTVSAGTHWVALSAPGYQTDSTRLYVEQESWSDWLVPAMIALTDSAAAATDSLLPVPPEPASDAAVETDSLPEHR